MPNANEMVQQHWPEHTEHAEKYGPHSVDGQTGILCGCGELLGWPVEDEPEPDPFALPRPESARGQAAYDKAAATVAAARAKATGRTDDYAAEPKVRQGAFGTYSEVSGAGVPAEPVAAPEEPLDAEVIEDVPNPALAADGPVTDEAQTYEVGETVTVGGIEFTKKAEHPSVFTPPEPYTTTEAEAAEITAGIEESVREAAELAEFGHCDAGAYEGFNVCWEPAVTDKPRRFCRDHWFVGTEQCDAFVPDGHESADQCQGRTEFEAAENMLCEDHAEWTGTGVSGNVYVNGRVDGDDWHASLERSRCTFVFEHKPCVFQVLHTVDYHHLSDGRDVHSDGTVDAAIPTTDAPASEVEQETGLTPGSGTPIMPTSPDSMDPVGSYYPPIDPTQVYTPQDIEIAIVEILRRLGNGEAFLREQIARLHQADYAYTMRYNLKIATSKARAADQRKAEAILACKNEIYEQTEADMLVRALRDTMHNLRSQLAGFQTVARSVGVSMGAPNFRP
jgi:hypothetical protein